VTGDYTTGLDAILGLQVRTFTYKGNETMQPTGEDDPAVSPHADLAAAGTEIVGLIAQEAELVMPELVIETDAYIDNELVSDFRVLDPTNLQYATINAFKEINARLRALEEAA
jgi:hypothetical protein